MTHEWTRQPRRYFQHLLREVDAIGLNPASLIAEAREMGANGYIAMGGGFSAWYPSALSSQTVNPHLETDVLGGIVAAAKSSDVRVLVRMDISKAREGTEAIHPEWLVHRPDGSIGTVWDMPQICATGPFWQHENFAILDEIASRYDADGFFYNYFYVARCYCERCERIVREATGMTVPAPGVRSPAYENWRQQSLAAYSRRLQQHIHAKNPDAAFVPYHHVRDGWDVDAMSAVSDIIAVQASNPVVPNPIDPQPMWNHWAAEEALKARALKPKAAPLLIQSTSEFFASRQTALPSGRLLHNLTLAAAHGASTAPAVNGTLVQDDPRFIPTIRNFGAFITGNAQWYEGLTSPARIAILRSEDSVAWGPDGGKLAGDVNKPGHVAEFRGLYEALSALRYPCDLVLSGTLTLERLSRYEMVILPAVSCLSTSDAAAIDQYVQAGGTILATADLAACNEFGQQADEPLLSALPARPGAEQSAVGAYFEIVAPALQQAFENVPQIGASGPFWSPFALGDKMISADLRLIGPFANNAPEFTVVKGPGTHPGLIERAFGKGIAQWLPWRIGALYQRYGIAEYLTLIGHLVARIIGAPPIVSDASPAVDFTLYHHPKGMVLHVLNGATVQGRPLIETTPLVGFDIAIVTRAETALCLQTQTQIPARREGDHLVVSLKRLDTFATIALLDAAPDLPYEQHRSNPGTD